MGGVWRMWLLRAQTKHTHKHATSASFYIIIVTTTIIIIIILTIITKTIIIITFINIVIIKLLTMLPDFGFLKSTKPTNYTKFVTNRQDEQQIRKKTSTTGQKQ